VEVENDEEETSLVKDFHASKVLLSFVGFFTSTIMILTGLITIIRFWIFTNRSVFFAFTNIFVFILSIAMNMASSNLFLDEAVSSEGASRQPSLCLRLDSLS
jgi:hypothetical protein